LYTASATNDIEYFSSSISINLYKGDRRSFPFLVQRSYKSRQSGPSVSGSRVYSISFQRRNINLLFSSTPTCRSCCTSACTATDRSENETLDRMHVTLPSASTRRSCCNSLLNCPKDRRMSRSSKLHLVPPRLCREFTKVISMHI
jgi:hypothetical protein